METKICDGCDAEIGTSETKCPRCGEDLTELEEMVSAVDKANNALAKRKAREEKARKDRETPTPTPAAKKSFSERMRSLGRIGKKA
jgi:hypothetical protein